MCLDHISWSQQWLQWVVQVLLASAHVRAPLKFTFTCVSVPTHLYVHNLVTTSGVRFTWICTLGHVVSKSHSR